MNAALAAQSGQRFTEAEDLYRQALAIDCDNFDAVHMLGVTCYQQSRFEEACRLILRAVELRAGSSPPLAKNLGLALSAFTSAQAFLGGELEQTQGLAGRSFFRRGNLPPLPGDLPLVSVIADCRRGTGGIRETLASVARQSYPNIELLLIDGGEASTDLADALQGLPIPYQIISQTNSGDDVALNAATERASGPYLSLVEAGDAYDPQRIEWLLRATSGAGGQWGFSNLAYVDELGQPVRYGDRPDVNALFRRLDALCDLGSVSAGFLEDNPVVCSGNLLFDRRLWIELGGFSGVDPIWAFCLEAVLVSEPIFLDEPAYRRRIRCIGVSDHREPADDSEATLVAWRRGLDEGRPIANSALVDSIRSVSAKSLRLMAAGLGHLVGVETLLRYADELGLKTDSACAS